MSGVYFKVKLDSYSIDLDTMYRSTELFLFTKFIMYLALCSEYGCFLKMFLLSSLTRAFC